MSSSIIQKSHLEGAHRLDAEYYQPEYLEFAKRLLLIGEFPLGKLAFITDGQHGYHKVDPSSKIHHITAKNVKQWIVNNVDADRLSKETHLKNKRSILTVGDLLTSTAGTIGEVGIVLEDVLPANIDQDVARIHILDSQKINPFFLLAFLNSKYGQFQFIRETTGQIQTHLALEKIKDRIYIPIPKWQHLISDKVKEAINLLGESKEYYSKAENLLLEELGLKDFQPKDDLSFVVNLSDVQSAHRADAEFFQPKYAEVLDHIKTPVHKLGQVTTFLNHAKQPPYVDGGEIPIVTQKHLGQAFLNADEIVDPETKYTSERWLEQHKTYKIRKGDVLYYSVGAYIGKTNVVLEDLVATSASFLTIIRPKKELDPICLAVILNSIVGKLQSKKWQSATAQQYIYPKDIRNFNIPVLPLKTQQKIAFLVLQSHAARKKSKELLEEAKRKVEEMIEKGNKIER